MNEAYGRSMAATVERLEAEKDDKSTFFAGGRKRSVDSRVTPGGLTFKLSLLIRSV